MEPMNLHFACPMPFLGKISTWYPPFDHRSWSKFPVPGSTEVRTSIVTVTSALPAARLARLGMTIVELCPLNPYPWSPPAPLRPGRPRVTFVNTPSLPFPELSKAVEPDTSSMLQWPTTPAAAAAGDANTAAPAATITMHQRRTSNVSPLPERERPSCAF